MKIFLSVLFRKLKVRGSVKSKLSSSRTEVAEPAKKITGDEKDQLDNLIKNR